MAKTIKFSLRLDDKPIRDIKGLQENFCIDDILELYDNGLLQKWLKVRGFDDYLKKVEAIKDDDSVIIQLINIFEIEKSEKEIMEATYSLRYWEERKLVLEEWNKKDTKVKQIIADYHNGYDVLKAEIEEKKEDMPFLKTAAKEIFDTYLGIFKIDVVYFFEHFKENVPLIIYALLMNYYLRNYWLYNQSIRQELMNEFTLSNCKSLYSFHKQFDPNIKDYGACTSSYRSGSGYGSQQSKFTEEYQEEFNQHTNKFGLSIFSGQTDGYWKDLEVESTKVMVLSIPAGTFIRNANKPKEELSADDVNGNFLIIDGLLYKSKDENNHIVYMEV